MARIAIAKDQRSSETDFLCLRFANTLDWRIGGAEQESLNSYADLVVWSVAQDLSTPQQQEYSARQAERHPKSARLVLKRALILREAIHRLLHESSHERSLSDEDIALINAELRPALAQLALVHDEEGLRLVCTDEGVALDWMLRPVALSAAELLTSPNVDRVRQCADDAGNGCGFWFYDNSRNRSRRWCSMEGCGNRAKARRHYQRERDAAPQPHESAAAEQ